VEDRATENNLSSPNNGNKDEEERNMSEEERAEVPRKCSTKERNQYFL
jgi:hypothetical protein